MVTPRMTATRRRSSALSNPNDPGADVSPTEVVIPKGTKAEVVEHVGGKTLVYEAEVKKQDIPEIDERESEFNGNDNERDFERFDTEDYQPNTPIVRTPLDQLFDNIGLAIKQQDIYDVLTAKIVRMPDAIADRFNTPCREVSELGIFQFSIRDRFDFLPQIQRLNADSGGRFVITVYDAEYQPLNYRPVNASIHSWERPITASLLVQNPIIKPIAEQQNNNSGGGNDTLIIRVLERMEQSNQEFRRTMLEQLNRRPEKSVLEMALEQKITNEILNPSASKGFDVNEFTQTIMTQGAVMAGLGEAFNKMIFREPAAPPEPTTFDMVMKVADHPVTQQLAGKVMDIVDAAAATQMAIAQKNAGIADAPEAQSEYEFDPMPENNPNHIDNFELDDNNNMQELITDIVTELESDNPLDGSNVIVQNLQTKFPRQFNMLTMACKGASFDDVFKMLLEQTVTIEPYPFKPYLDTEASQQQNDYIFNAQGLRMKVRLNEFYNYIQTT